MLGTSNIEQLQNNCCRAANAMRNHVDEGAHVGVRPAMGYEPVLGSYLGIQAEPTASWRLQWGRSLRQSTSAMRRHKQTPLNILEC